MRPTISSRPYYEMDAEDERRPRSRLRRRSRDGEVERWDAESLAEFFLATVRPTVDSRAWRWCILMILSAEMMDTNRLTLLMTNP